ncbi:ATP-binding protein [Streptomyces sp. NPDC004609]|uniref:ATP-binding protein n=1 Tax=Streptomyces sp. NPDC004609 TaxID=3364704 RepID=UPI0036A11290
MPITITRPDTTALAGFEVSLCQAGKAGDPLTDEDRLWPGLMRRAAQAHLGLWKLDALADTVDLLMSELVTNALQHGEGAVGVRVWRTGTQLCIEVGCASTYTPRPTEAGPLDENGRGLYLVGALADGWGVTASGTWCVLTLDRSGS